MRKNTFYLLRIPIVVFIVMVFLFSAVYSQPINVKDYIKEKFPSIFSFYLSSLEDLDSYEKEFIDLLEKLPEEKQEYYAKEVYKNGFSLELLEKLKKGKTFVVKTKEKPKEEVPEEGVALTPTPMPTDTPFPSPTATMSPPQSTAPSYRAQIKISTTSDWTEFRLVAGGIWYDLTVASASEQALSAGLDGDHFSLSQSIDRAEAGESIELVADAFFTELDPEGMLEFEIERGHIGSTQVEISSYQDEIPRVIAVLTWDGISSGPRNTRVFDVSSEAFVGTRPNDYIVIAQLNFWYYGPGLYGGFEDDFGERNTSLTPLLGETYWASDPDVVYQQIEWAVEYGVDAFSIEWTTPRGIGCCGSMEDTLDDVFLKSPNIHKVRWAIFYDFVLRLAQTPGLERHVGSFDFDEPEVYDTFVSDFKHFAQKYFGHPQYLTIDERPVIYIWATNAYVGNLEGALREAREEVAKLGYDVFVVGDEVVANRFDPYHASLFDGNTTFTFLIPGLNRSSWADIGDAAAAVDQTFERWRANINDLKVFDREEYVNFQPAWTPQYDDRLIVPDHATYVPAASKDQVIAMAEVALKHAQPIGSQGQKLIWLNTWNCWAETTTVEPTANLGPKYPAGNYQFDMLEVVREVFGVETFYTSPLP